MIEELDCVLLKDPIPALGVEAGSIGTIVHVYPGAVAFEVELFTPFGDTIGVVTLDSGKVSPISFEEVRRRRRKERIKGLNAVLDRASGEIGPRLTLPDVQERFPGTVAQKIPADWMQDFGRLRLVTKKTGKKFPRCIVKGVVIYDLKAAEPEGRRAVYKVLNKLTKSVQTDPLGNQIAFYLKQLNETLDALK